jgi:hypothetical protein
VETKYLTSNLFEISNSNILIYNLLLLLLLVLLRKSNSSCAKAIAVSQRETAVYSYLKKQNDTLAFSLCSAGAD